MSAETATVSPTVRFTAYRPLSRTGAGLAILIRLGRSLRFGAGISAQEYPTSRSHEPHSYIRGAAAPDLSAVRTARPGGLRVGRLAGRRRAIVVADAAPGPARRARVALQVGVRVCGLAGALGRACGSRVRRGTHRVPRALGRLDRGLDR